MLLIVHGTYTGISMHFMIVITFQQISHAFTDFTLCSGRFLHLVIFLNLLDFRSVTLPFPFYYACQRAHVLLRPSAQALLRAWAWAPFKGLGPGAIKGLGPGASRAPLTVVAFHSFSHAFPYFTFCSGGFLYLRNFLNLLELRSVLLQFPFWLYMPRAQAL